MEGKTFTNKRDSCILTWKWTRGTKAPLTRQMISREMGQTGPAVNRITRTAGTSISELSTFWDAATRRAHLLPVLLGYCLLIYVNTLFLDFDRKGMLQQPLLMKKQCRLKNSSGPFDSPQKNWIGKRKLLFNSRKIQKPRTKMLSLERLIIYSGIYS